MHVLVWYPSEETDLSHWKALGAKYPEVSFFFYIDQGVDLGLYIPQLRPHIIKRHFALNSYLTDKVIFYHDSDIIFNYLPDFGTLGQGEINWTSNCSSYMDYNYLRNKEIEGNIPENEAIGKLCEIGNITIDTIKNYGNDIGGAQYILKNLTPDFWEDVERICIDIRRNFYHGSAGSINAKYFSKENDGFQSWCADMWAVVFALWSRNKPTHTTPLLDFSWATDSEETYLSRPIFHNAGATQYTLGVFVKQNWMNRSPIGKAHAIKRDTASWYYAQAIKEVSKLT
jgi:hypothetical protein